jgi:hypothetical protein
VSILVSNRQQACERLETCHKTLDTVDHPSRKCTHTHTLTVTFLTSFPHHVCECQGAYEFIKQKGYVPYDTCQPYLACSSESKDGFCSRVDTTCSAANTCRTCVHGASKGKNGVCTEIDVFPNATIAEYGSYSIFETDRVHKIMAEIYARGPVAAGT